MAKLHLYKKVISVISETELGELFTTATCFELSNLTHSMPKYHNFSLLPPVTPPYKNMWLEARNSSNNWGYLLQCFDLREDKDEDIWIKTTTPVPENIRWRVEALVHIEWNKRAYAYNSVIRLLLDEDGLLVPTPFEGGETYIRFMDMDKSFASFYTTGQMIDAEFPRNTEEFTAYGVFLTYALALMNTKNVHMIDSEKGKRRGKRRRHKGHSHYTLRIRPGGRKSVSSSQSTGDKNAFHFARGHFKTYTEKAPLLGKHVGTYWWEAHTRGSKTKGTITKDYEVHPAKEESTK